MTRKLVWGILGGTVIGAMFGSSGGNAGITIAIGIAAGALAAGIWHYLETRNRFWQPLPPNRSPAKRSRQTSLQWNRPGLRRLTTDGVDHARSGRLSEAFKPLLETELAI